jgi:hypothetical protein
MQPTLSPVHKSPYRNQFMSDLETPGQFPHGIYVLTIHGLSARPSDATPAFIAWARGNGNIKDEERQHLVPDVDAAGAILDDWFHPPVRRLPHVSTIPPALHQFRHHLAFEESAAAVKVLTRFGVSINEADIDFYPAFKDQVGPLSRDMSDAVRLATFTWLSPVAKPIEKESSK